jgi:hypothetical protein
MLFHLFGKCHQRCAHHTWRWRGCAGRARARWQGVARRSELTWSGGGHGSDPSARRPFLTQQHRPVCPGRFKNLMRGHRCHELSPSYSLCVWRASRHCGQRARLPGGTGTTSVRHAGRRACACRRRRGEPSRSRRGCFDIQGDRGARPRAVGQIEFRYGKKLFYIGPAIGILATTKGAVFCYGGIYADFRFGRFVVTPLGAIGGYTRAAARTSAAPSSSEPASK